MIMILDLFFTFLKIGTFTFGGGYAMLPLIQEQVIKNGWISKEILIDFVAISESTPGPFAINIATFVGNELAGFLGAIITTLGTVLPSFIIILLVAKFFTKFKENKFVKGCMVGLKPCVIGLIAVAIVSMAKTVFFPNGIKNFVINREFIMLAIITGISTCFISKKLHPILVICLSGIFGIFSGILVLEV